MTVSSKADSPEHPRGHIITSNVTNISRLVPIPKSSRVRMLIGFVLLVLACTLTTTIYGAGNMVLVLVLTALAWLPATLLTDKYVHKYPQRYLPYLIVSHTKAGVIMALGLFVLAAMTEVTTSHNEVFWIAFFVFVLADGLASLPCRRVADPKALSQVVSADLAAANSNTPSVPSHEIAETRPCTDTQHIVSELRRNLDTSAAAFVENNVTEFPESKRSMLVLDDIDHVAADTHNAEAALLVTRKRINDVHRLNRFLQFCANNVAMRGYLVLRYLPLENAKASLRRRHPGMLYWPALVLHFLWYRALPKIPWLDRLYFSIPWLDCAWLSLTQRRNRALSRAELWGRLAYFGMSVTAESKDDDEIFLIAQRVSLPVANTRPSYYLVVGLEKVGLDGKIIRTHKIRTMYPFSEFIQKRIFQDHGLTATGKFANDFRLTDYGRFLRKYWLDEIPQIVDWLRGDIKLVGIRATSQHFLSLYPKHFLDLYVQIKPGLVPPIFDESITSFDQIVDVELTYLQRYVDRPFRTDAQYLLTTFTDIVFRGIRSK